MQSCFFKKNKKLSNSNISHHHTRLSFITKKCYNLVEILAYAFTAMAQKKDHHVIALWLKDFEELEA